MLKRKRQEKPRRKKKGPGLAEGRKGRGGQSTVEYIILVAAIIGAMVIFLPGTFIDSYNKTLESGINGMQNMADRLQTSRPLAP